MSDPTRAQTLHDQLVEARQAEHAATHRLCHLLAALASERLYAELGYSTIHHYGRVALDLTSRQTADYLRIGRLLPDYPELDRAMSQGEIGWTKVREILRIVTPDTEAEWVARARQRTSRELEKEVAHCRHGDRPPKGDVATLDPARRRLTFVLESADAQTLADALALLRSQLDEQERDTITDGALLAMFARRLIHDAHQEASPTAERYRVVLQDVPGLQPHPGARRGGARPHRGGSRV